MAKNPETCASSAKFGYSMLVGQGDRRRASLLPSPAIEVLSEIAPTLVSVYTDPSMGARERNAVMPGPHRSIKVCKCRTANILQSATQFF